MGLASVSMEDQWLGEPVLVRLTDGLAPGLITKVRKLDNGNVPEIVDVTVFPSDRRPATFTYVPAGMDVDQFRFRIPVISGPPATPKDTNPTFTAATGDTDAASVTGDRTPGAVGRTDGPAPTGLETSAAVASPMQQPPQQS